MKKSESTPKPMEPNFCLHELVPDHCAICNKDEKDWEDDNSFYGLFGSGTRSLSGVRPWEGNRSSSF